MTIDPALPADTLSPSGLLVLMTWLSPSFPVGAFAYSHGIEAAAEDGLVADETGLEAYVRAALEHGAGAVDAALFAGIWRAVHGREQRDLHHYLERGSAMRGTAELAAESTLQGAAFWKTVRDTSPDAALDWVDKKITVHGGPLPYPCAVAAAAACAGVPLLPALAAFLHAFTANLVSAGVRLIPLGQTAGQRITARLAPAVEAAAVRALATPFCDVGTAAFLIDIFSMTHETQYTRLFRS